MKSESPSSSKPGSRVLVTGASGFIGTHLVNHLLACGHDVVNVDIAAPQSAHASYWRKVSILDAEALAALMKEYAPTYVVHLAAYATMDARSLDDFKVNIEGTRNVLQAIRGCPSVQRAVITSSQHVRKPGCQLPEGDTDYEPFELYGESKVLTEKLTREAGLTCAWTLIRPTTVWGPFQPPLADGVWRILKRGLYLHPSNDPVLRSYGYVKNVVWQIERLLQVPVERVAGKTLYVGDENIRQYEWVNGFARALTGRNVRTMPLAVIRMLAVIGDGLRALGVGFPMYSLRLHSMITPNAVPIQATLEALGRPPYTLQDGIRETVEWLDQYYREQASR